MLASVVIARVVNQSCLLAEDECELTFLSRKNLAELLEPILHILLFKVAMKVICKQQDLLPNYLSLFHVPRTVCLQPVQDLHKLQKGLVCIDCHLLELEHLHLECEVVLKPNVDKHLDAFDHESK